MSEWKIIGQMGSIIKKKQSYIVNIAENRYALNPEKNEYEKRHTIWFNCICCFEPHVKTGDKVIAEGTFEPSRNEKFPFAMKIEHIGVINGNEDIIKNS